MVASKIVGRWGAAKDATLVPVQVRPDTEEDIEQGFKMIQRDVLRRRRKTEDFKAIVFMSRDSDKEIGPNFYESFKREEAERSQLGRDQKHVMGQLLDLGIPIVLASGNQGDQEDRHVIDAIPQVLESEDFPVINVGAATLEGKAWSKTQSQCSQDGTQLTIYGVGVDVDVHNHKNGEGIKGPGTSFAAPAVVGINAVHMNYVPWDTSKVGLERVKEIKRWIRTADSSWQRAKDEDKEVNMIWTGADKQAHEQAAAKNDNDNDSDEQTPPSNNPKNTFLVGLEQTVIPHCETIVPWGVNQVPSTSCEPTPDYSNKLFFYRLETGETEVDSLCTSYLHDFYQPADIVSTDKAAFEEPSWPAGEWTLSLFDGQEFAYKNDGQTAGAVFKMESGGDKQIACSGDLGQHDPKSDEWCEDTLTEVDGKRRRRRRLLACKW